MSPLKCELLKGHEPCLRYFVSLGNSIVPQYLAALQLIFASWMYERINTTIMWVPTLCWHCHKHFMYIFISSQQPTEVGIRSSDRESNLAPLPT